MNHPVLSALAAMEAALDEVAGVDPMFMAVEQRKAALTCSAKLRARAEAFELKLMAASDDIAETTGDRSTADWLATRTRDNHGTVRLNAGLAKALDTQWAHMADAFGDGRLNLAQVRVIADALTALPKDLDAALLFKAEIHLVDQAAEFGPRDLARLGAKVLSVVAPEIADEAEYQKLLADERRADAATRLNLRRRGDGSTDVSARIPDFHAGLLRAFLNAFTAPRRRHLDSPFGPTQRTEPDEFANLPLERQRGIAFVALLERILGSQLPRHGGRATTVSVTIPWETLRQQVEEAGIAVTTTGDRVTVGQTRRLACQAGILPFVMGGKSVVLDHGREKRLYDHHQRAALNLIHPECTAVGCTMPAEFCHAHHKVPWSEGGSTDLDDGTILCPFHHDRAHDPRWITSYHANGDTTFHPRQ